MDNEEFLKRLSEVSEWHRPQLSPNGNQSICKKPHKLPEHPGPVTEDELEAMTEWEVKQYYTQLMAWREAQPNESVQPEILRVKTQAKNCEDCGRHCPTGRKTERKLHHTGSRHWREFCTECELFKSPVSGLYEIPKLGSHQFFLSYYRPKLGVYRSKFQPEPKLKPEPKVKREPKISKEARLTKTEIMEKILNEGTWHTHETEDSIIRRFEQKK